MEYEFNQTVEEEDYVAFVNNHLKSTFFKPFNLVLFIVSIGYLIISPFVTGEQDFTFLYIGIGIIVLLVGMVIFVRRNAKKQYQKNPGLFRMKYVVDDTYLYYKISEGDIKKEWKDFYSINETENYLYLYLNKNNGVVFVKNQINNDIIRFIKQKAKENITDKRVKLLSE
ncbi:MAG: YcxB family protein [Candidatus Izimaplasma sp.]|nr:YcxB family protein [Candidatus Izimaplasma bacterium]